jgi:hypothetical protein
MENIIWDDRLRNEEVLCGVKEEGNILHVAYRRKCDWFGHVVPKNCFLQHDIEGKKEGYK